MMRLIELRVRNFRSIRNETFDFPSLSILIGRNNSGKSNVLDAVRILLEGTSKDISEDDFFDPTVDIEIRGTFAGVRQYLALCEQRHRPRIEQRIDEEGAIIIRRTVPAGTTSLGKIEIKSQSGEFSTPTGIDAGLRTILPEVIAIMPLDDPADEATGKRTKTLGKLVKQILKTVQTQVQPELDAAYEGASSLLNIVQVEREGSLIEQDNRVLDIQRIERTITTRLQQTFRGATVRLKVDFPVVEEILGRASLTVLEGGAITPVHRQGHGIQRVLYLSLLQTLAEEIRRDSQEELFRPFMLIIEEPELFLHPAAQERMREALDTISTRAQVLMATHSPLSVSPKSLRQVILLEKAACPEAGKEETKHRGTLRRRPATPSERDLITLLNLRRSAQVFFNDKVILVEGIGDQYLLQAMVESISGSTLDSLNIGIVEVGGKDKLLKFKGILESLGLRANAFADLDFLWSGAGDVFRNDPLYSQFCQELNARVAEACPDLQDTEEARRERKAKLTELCCSEFCRQRDELCDRLRSEGIFVLRQGETQDYVGLTERSKGRYLIAAREIVDGERSINNEDEIRTIVNSLLVLEVP